MNINFSNKLIDLSLREALINDMKKSSSPFLIGEYWEECEQVLVDYFTSDGDFFENHMFEDKYRLGKDERKIESIDPLNLHSNYDNYQELPFTRAIDQTNKIVNTFSAIHPEKNADDRIYILEVGGGYGRTALFFLNYFGPRVCYINVDAVPTSVLVSEQFLKHNARKDIKISGYGDIQAALDKNEPIDFTQFNYLSLPSWHADLLPDNFFDIAMNIWSMQEMNRRHEALYYKLWERVCKEDALLFFLNVNKRKFKNGYRFPKKWPFIYEGKEATYGNPERLFIINPSASTQEKFNMNSLSSRLKSYFAYTATVNDDFNKSVETLQSILHTKS